MKSKKIKSYIIISNGNGGIATFQKYLIKNIIKISSKIYLIDRKKNPTEKYFQKINIKNKINYLYCDPILEPKKVLKYLDFFKKKNSQEKLIFIFSNPLLMIMYIFFIKFKFNNNKIYLFIHSHILKYNFSQILINFISSLISPLTDKVFFVSKFTRSWWLKYFFFYNFSNNEVHLNSVQLPKLRKKKLKIINIGFVGRLEKEKGVNIFFNLAKYMKNNEFKFHMFGDGSLKSKEFKNKNIFKYKWSNQKKIFKIIDILLLTSPVENCPFSVLEAKSYGIPTLSISKGGVKEIIENYKDGIILEENINDEKIKKNLLLIKKNFYKYRINCIKNRIKFDEKVNFSKLLKKI